MTTLMRLDPRIEYTPSMQAFGNLWAKEVKKQRIGLVLPSPQEIVDGVEAWFFMQLKVKLSELKNFISDGKK